MKKWIRVMSLFFICAALLSIAVSIVGLSIETFFDSDFKAIESIGITGFAIIIAGLCISLCFLSYEIYKEE